MRLVKLILEGIYCESLSYSISFTLQENAHSPMGPWIFAAVSF